MLQYRMLLKYLLRMSDLEMTYVYLYQGMHVCNQQNINVNSVGSAFKGTGSLTPWNQKGKIDVSTLRRSSGGLGKTTRVFIRVNTEISREKIEANWMDLKKKQSVNRKSNSISIT